MLKAAYEAVQPSTAASFSVRTFAEQAFTAPYHHHPEYELTLIVKGTGQRYVGSHIADYGPGDLVLLGAHVPHCWKTAPGGAPGELSAESVVVQFGHDFLGPAFFNQPELYPVAQLLERSAAGLRFAGRSQQAGGPRLLAMSGEIDPLRRLLALLAVLQDLAAAPDYELLDPRQRLSTLAPAGRERYQRVMAYLVEHFRGDVTLAQAAEVAHLTPNAFCKYFKTLTRKTFIETLIEVRLQYAAQQLVQTNQPVAEICFASGFGDVSYFNKTFRAHLRRSPLQYRRAFRPGGGAA